jgi:hypothetical protein
MKNCFSCSINKECELGRMMFSLEEYLPYSLYEQIENIIRIQFNCDYYEN